MPNSENEKLDLMQKARVTKHLLWRVGFLVIPLILMFYAAAFTGNGWWVLTVLFLGFGLAVIWFLFILIEIFILFSKKKNNLVKINLIMLSLFIFLGAIIFYNLHQ